ncbi:hypothetical protein AL036_11515 [Salipiger aestuarii]|uniref:Uncharacterized protein DUF3429 n=1 Tax=Salipiger aestuarii TaxID=568098 RepID=A0A327Y251_9RHOB|nr:DUF3429 domain-containing protein [Salipiger aestuarii]EIE49340.1 hypothetical protein C357_19481 [Citreicella sp. 357]KAA8607230.1 hypothetical protein AL036_11515 [Salipiger aestuarii]KAA8610277.1 hypothetical protein AL037_13655 [Salipiger aestuarii]KAB2541697.1 hypothetical protein AL035_10990 [Salipiger aestuarii]RAK15278.1 uncharacterized protein DUF3429 [Salipiger aestuarii]
MGQVPRSALLLAIAGLIPLGWSVATLVSDPAYEVSYSVLGGRFVGPYLHLSWGAVILAFMSGVLWGFATKAPRDQAAVCYALSVIPALWAFFMAGGGPVSAGMNLIFGYLGLLALDWQFWRWGLAPGWWLHLRLPMTVGVVALLLFGVMA